MDKVMLKKMADTIRFLSADMIQKANSGHPGVCLGMADVLTLLSTHLKHNPKNPKWLNRDRLVFSGGHASAMIYSFLYLCGYDISIDDLKNFRQLGSKTPGHPEYGEVPGVEITTGPLGQGVANAVGFAMASKYAKKLLNSETAKIIDHKVYCLCGDGDLEEGISISLGADGAPCNNNLNMFTEMRLAALIQKPIHSPVAMDALTVFRLATIEGAKALHIEEETGSIEVGKKADMVLLNLNVPTASLLDEDANIYSDIVYSANRDNVKYVFVEGKTIVAKGESLIYDEEKLFAEGKSELQKLLERAEVDF